MLLEALSAVSDLGRFRVIAGILAKHGFGDLIDRTDIRRALARVGRALHLRKSGDVEEASTPARARQALEELGPTFAKLGQLLANRPDLLPLPWIEELSKLHAAHGLGPSCVAMSATSAPS
jgi:ubiquinone biosynthesis protein